MQSNPSMLPELLAPAGSLEIGISALNSGADAVYAGLSRFNARERTKNFDIEQMELLINYAHTNKKKVYVTFNTLIKDNEIYEAVKLLAKLDELQPDAVIIQDLGILYALRKYFPLLKIHASTQMAIHNSPGVNLLSELGIERIILERQVTNEELKLIRTNSSAELEVFVHGALCCSLSGSCLLSSWLGGWSGNRGKCKQACRRRYYSENDSGFYLSTKDLYSLDNVGMLKQLGISSLKIEGRLRGSYYVDNVVKAYRMVLDSKLNDKKVLKEAKSIISSVPSRTWSSGFSTKDGLKNIIEPDKLGVQGKHCGKVLSASKRGFEVKIANTIRINDKIRIQPPSGDEGPSVLVTKLSIQGKKVTSLKPGQAGLIHCDKDVKPGWNVYKLSQVKSEEKSFKAPKIKLPIVPEIIVTKDKIKVKLLNYSNIPEWTSDIASEKADKLSLQPEMICKEFKKTGKLDLRVCNISAKVSDNIYLPNKLLKNARQNYYSWLESILSKTSLTHKSSIEELLNDFKSSEIRKGFSGNQIVTTFACKSEKVKVKSSCKRAIPLSSARETTRNCEIILPFFCPEDKVDSVKNQIHKCIENGLTTFRITSLYQLNLLPENQDIKLHMSFPLPVANSLAVKQLLELNAKKVQLWPELEKNNIELILDKCGKACEIYIYGRLSVLNTRAKLPVSGKIRDKRGIEFRIANEYGLSILLPQKIFAIESITDISSYVDLTNANENEQNTYSFNFNGSLA